MLSDTNLRSLGAQKALSQHPHPHHHQHGQSGSNKSGSHTPGATKKKTSDSEWLLRAGLALTSSTREEKGQSWLVKRESSTSLVADADPDIIRATTTTTPRHHHHHHHQRGRSTPFRSGRSSGVSTPGQYSRRSSISREAGRYASRADFGMTSLDVEQHNGGESRQSRKSSVGSYHVTLPDFVDAKIRAELASIDGRARDGCYENDYDDENPHMSDSLSMDSDADSDDDELDEMEFQRLTREQGFGLGTWVDQFVSWTLFGVEEDISASPPPPLSLLPPSVSQDGSDRQTTVGFEPIDSNTDIDARQKESIGDDDSSGSAEQEEISCVVERAGDKGGWADASWFLRLARNAII